MQVDLNNVEYAGFWTRVLAMILDTLVLMMVMIPLLLMVLGPAVFNDPEVAGGWTSNMLQLVLPMVATVLFWKYRSATPGKMMMGLVVVDADTGAVPSTGRLVLRYLAYLVSALPLGLGYLWVAFDKRKQGFHDKIAHSLVVRKPAASQQ